MGFIYGLAVVLLIFEGIIIECDGGGGRGARGAESSNRSEDPSSKEEQQILMSKLLYMIEKNILYKTLQETKKNGVKNAGQPSVSEILQNCIIRIKTSEFNGEIGEHYEDGELFLGFGDYDKLMEFFDNFGDQVKKIEFDNADCILDNEKHNNIFHCIIKCGKNLEMLRIITYEEFWNDIRFEGNGDFFPQVKTFQFVGEIKQMPYDLDIMFPKLETFYLNGDVDDGSFLNNVSTLKELALFSETMAEYQLHFILKKSTNLTTIILSKPKKKSTIGLIKTKLKGLKKLEVRDPGKDFLLRGETKSVFMLPSVTQFDTLFADENVENLFEELSFEMENLEKLTLIAEYYKPDYKIVEFTKKFKKLKKVVFSVLNEYTIECIEKLQHIEKLTAYIKGNQLESLKQMIGRLDKNSRLQTLKLRFIDKDLYKTYKNNMIIFINNLNGHRERKWTLSDKNEIATNISYLIFKRKQ